MPEPFRGDKFINAVDLPSVYDARRARRDGGTKKQRALRSASHATTRNRVARGSVRGAGRWSTIRVAAVADHRSTSRVPDTWPAQLTSFRHVCPALPTVLPERVHPGAVAAPITEHGKTNKNAPISGQFGGEGGIRTHVPGEPDHLISSQRRYDRFGTSPERSTILTV